MALYWRKLAAELRTTIVYESFWHFAAERQQILAKRLRGESPPWTSDPILVRYRFTNAYRAADRVSQYLIRSVIYHSDTDASNGLFRILLFKFFNRIETWQLLVDSGLKISVTEFDWERASDLLSREIRQRRAVYSAAYIMPPGPQKSPKRAKHDTHFEIIKKMLNDGLERRLLDCKNMKEAYCVLRSYPLMGPFLAYQLVTDINYSPLTSFDEMEFTRAGPGARSGIAKCFSNRADFSDEDIIRLTTDRQEEEFAARDLTFPTLWGRRLQLIDVQNLFCEIDKYSRAKHSAFNAKGGRQRIKRRFTPGAQNVSLWFPPKWNLNDKIEIRPHL